MGMTTNSTNSWTNHQWSNDGDEVLISDQSHRQNVFGRFDTRFHRRFDAVVTVHKRSHPGEIRCLGEGVHARDTRTSSLITDSLITRTSSSSHCLIMYAQ